MEVQPSSMAKAKTAPLPALPQENPLTQEQWRTLLAIADAVIPSIGRASTTDANSFVSLPVPDGEVSSMVEKIRLRVPSNSDNQLIEDYLAEKPSELPAFRDGVQRIVACYMPTSSRNQIIQILNMLNTRAGSLFMTGSFTPIADQPIHVRATIIQGWAGARLPMFRQLGQSLTALCKQTWVKHSATLERTIGFPRTPVHGTPGKHIAYEFLQFPPGESPEVIETDVIIVGSGCGAGVCAKTLAEAGNKVIVAEKGFYWSPEYLPMNEDDGLNHLFMDGAALMSDDASIGVATGATWGGGGTVNWSASLQTQGYVRKEWASMGLPFFTSPAFQASLDRICDRMGVSTKFIKHNKGNQVLLEGARKLGWAHKEVPQNTGGKQHYCGYCSFGCGSCEKQGPIVSFLPDAAKAGAVFIEGFNAEKVIFKNIKGAKVAVGVQGEWRSRDLNGGSSGTPTTTRKVIIHAKRVIVSCGTMQSPLLLLRSGLKNSQIGRNLHLHPVAFGGAIMDEDVRPWEGSILTAVINEFENLDHRGHGAKLESTCMTPAMNIPWTPWFSGPDFKLHAASFARMIGNFSIARDRDTGRIYPDPIDGRVRIEYSTSEFDRKHILEGLVGLSQVMYAGGAREIFLSAPMTPKFVREDPIPNVAEDISIGGAINDTKFNAWLDGVRARGLPSQTMFVSAHQMGTCRMGSSAAKSVVDQSGAVWGVENLYVADASVFPSASGVNPMVTNMAISDWISRGIANGLSRENESVYSKVQSRL